jgi:hypothetical protein
LVSQFIELEREVASIDLLSYLSIIPAPRIDRNKKHDLPEILFVACCAVISGRPGYSYHPVGNMLGMPVG